MIFRIVLGNAVDHDGNPPLVESADIQIIVTDAVAILRVERCRWQLAQELGDVLDCIALRQILSGESGKGERCFSFSAARGGYHDRLTRKYSLLK